MSAPGEVIEEIERREGEEIVETVSLEDRNPFTQVGDWIVLSGISHKAVRLYWLLSMHLNASRGDRLVWPSRATLAAMMGLADPKSVDSALKELVEIGAVVIIKRRYKGTKEWLPNRYIVKENPPADYKGLRSNAEFYARRKEAQAGRQVTTETVSAAQVVAEKVPPPPSEGDGGGRGESSPTPGGTFSGGGGGKSSPENEKKINEIKKKKNLSPQGESRASTPGHVQAHANITPEAEAQPTEVDLFSEFDHELQEENPSKSAMSEPARDTKIPTIGEGKHLSVDAEVSSIDEPKQRRALARDIADRWWKHCDLQGKPFPRSEPGTKFPKIAEFGGLLSKILLSYSEQEIWAALVAILDLRHNAYPSRPELERTMNAERARLAQPAPSSPTWPSPSTGVEALDPVIADLVNRAVTWWREDHYLPTTSEARFRGMLADALAQGVTPKQVADALRACDKADPPPWDFANALTKVRQGLDAKQARQAAGLAPKLSRVEEREKRKAENKRARHARAEQLKAEMGLSDPRNDEPVITGTIIQGEVS
jgi:hypothetical protein